MTSRLPDILLLLFIINLGTAFGAGIYEMRIIVPQWFVKLAGSGYQVNTQAMQQTDTGRKFWAFVTTGPLTLITLANLVVAWQSPQPEHSWWLAAVWLTLLERVGTFIFFIPTAIKLQRADESASPGVVRLINLWVGSNYVRTLLNLLAWIAALLAFHAR